MRIKELAMKAMLGSVLILTGCKNDWTTQDHWHDMVYGRESSGMVHADARHRSDLRTVFNHGEFGLSLQKYTDRVTPEAAADRVGNDIIHEYNPDKLLRGPALYMTGLIEDHFRSTVGDKPVVLPVELQMRDLAFTIRRGDFWSGRYGRYVVEMKADAVVRTPEGELVTIQQVDVTYDEARRSSNGRHLTLEQDRQNMLKAINNAVGMLAQEIIERVQYLSWPYTSRTET